MLQSPRLSLCVPHVCEEIIMNRPTEQNNLNAEVMNILYCGTNVKELNVISSCRNANNIWHILKVTHKGTIRVNLLTVLTMCMIMRMVVTSH